MLILFFFFKQIESFDLSISSGIIPLQDVHIRVQGPVPLPKLQDQNHTSWWPLYFASSACQWRHQGDWFLWISSSYLTSSNAGTRTPVIKSSHSECPFRRSAAVSFWKLLSHFSMAGWPYIGQVPCPLVPNPPRFLSYLVARVTRNWSRFDLNKCYKVPFHSEVHAASFVEFVPFLPIRAAIWLFENMIKS